MQSGTGGHTKTCRDPSGVATPRSDEILLGTPCLGPCRPSCLAPLTSDTQLSGFSRQGLEQGKDFSKQEPGFQLVLLSLQSRKTAGLGTPRGRAAPSCRLSSLSPVGGWVYQWRGPPSHRYSDPNPFLSSWLLLLACPHFLTHCRGKEAS